MAQIAFDQGAYETAVTLSDLVYEQYEARDDPAAVASILLVQAELAWKMGDGETAVSTFNRAYSLRQTIKRPLTPREQAQYQELADTITTIS
ncbi:MAG: tetratricopeptide repeat protein [Anaerolineae bacterium]|nr:tetratricopeptide repeat protein [Anaerolineae bacterium]